MTLATPTPPIRILLAVLLAGIAVGIMLGTAGTYSAITDSIEARADDGVPLVIDGSYYRITHTKPSTGNLTIQNPYIPSAP